MRSVPSGQRDQLQPANTGGWENRLAPSADGYHRLLFAISGPGHCDCGTASGRLARFVAVDPKGLVAAPGLGLPLRGEFAELTRQLPEPRPDGQTGTLCRLWLPAPTGALRQLRMVAGNGETLSQRL